MQWENNIKETLEKRRVEPSAKSWDTLADRLDASDKNKNTKPFWWMGIAASLVGVLLLANVFFKDATVDAEKPVKIASEKPINKERTSKILPIEPLTQQHVANGDVENRKAIDKNFNHEITEHKPESELSIALSPSIERTENTERAELSELVENSSQKQSFEDKKVSEIVAHINEIKSQGQTVTDADIDALLLKAQTEIALHAVLKESVLTVDAHSLLQEVEEEIQQSFRNKIFEALKYSYETVKTAVAKRND